MGVALLLAVMLPSLVSLFTGVDHCGVHDDGHIHLCFLHQPHAELEAWVVVALTVSALILLGRMGYALQRLQRGRRLALALTLTSQPQAADSRVSLVESSLPLCLTVGLWKPTVLFSRALWNGLTSAERAVLLAHEVEHIRRRDALFQLIARSFGVLHLPSIRCWLRQELELAAEQACDEAAGERVGDRVLVAEVLLKLARLRESTATHKLGGLAVSFNGSALERRVRNLLAEAGCPRLPRGLALGTAAALLAPLLASHQVHHAAESLISLLTG